MACTVVDDSSGKDALHADIFCMQGFCVLWGKILWQLQLHNRQVKYLRQKTSYLSYDGVERCMAEILMLAW